MLKKQAHIVQPASAAIARYTDRGAFEAALQSGYWLEPKMFNKHPNHTGNGFSCSGGATSDTFEIGTDLPTNDRSPSVIAFDLGPQTKAFGDYFWSNDPGGDFIVGSVQNGLNPGSLIFNEISASSTSFYGLLSDADISKVEISMAMADFATAGSVIVGSPVPAPVPGRLSVLGVGSALTCNRRLRLRVCPCAARRPVLRHVPA